MPDATYADLQAGEGKADSAQASDSCMCHPCCFPDSYPQASFPTGTAFLGSLGFLDSRYLSWTIYRQARLAAPISKCSAKVRDREVFRGRNIDSEENRPSRSNKKQKVRPGTWALHGRSHSPFDCARGPPGTVNLHTWLKLLERPFNALRSA